MTTTELPGHWEQFLVRARRIVSQSSAMESRGTLTRLAGLVLEANGIRAPVGSQCVVSMQGR